jgi:hypothetical protein
LSSKRQAALFELLIAATQLLMRWRTRAEKAHKGAQEPLLDCAPFFLAVVPQ